MSTATVAPSAAEGFARLAASCCGVEAGLLVGYMNGGFEISGAFGLRGSVATLQGSTIFAETLRRDDVFEVVQRPKPDRARRPGELHVYRFFAGIRVLDAAGAPIGLVAVLDPSARMLEPRAREQLRLLARGIASLDPVGLHDIREVIVRAHEHAPDPTLVYERRGADPSPTLVAVNRAFTRVAGLRAEAIVRGGIGALIGAATDSGVRRSMTAARSSARPMRATLALYPLGTSEAAPRWFDVSGFPIPSIAPGDPTYWIECYHDVTDRAVKITELASERNRLKFTLASMDDAVITADRTGRLVFMNHAARSLLDMSGEMPHSRMIDDGILRLRDLETEATLIAPLAHVRSNGKVLRERAVVMTRNESRRYVEYAVAPIERPKVGHDGFVIVLRDVTEEESLTRRLSFEASHDQLTAIFNRRYFDQSLARAFKGLKHGDQARHALAFLDLDRFKIINDTCGHAAGDDVLRDVAQLFKAQLRAHDVIARFGGDEFAILMHDCPIDVAARVMERIRARLREYVFTWDGHEFRLGVSIGLAAITHATPNAQAAMKQADAACYADKLARRTKQTGMTPPRGSASNDGRVSWLR